MTELAPGAVTTADLYRELVGMRQDITRALTRVEVIDTQTSDADKLHSDHEARLRILEAFRWKITGIALAASVVGGAVSGLLAAHIHLTLA